MARKTVDIAYLLERGNYFLANSEPEQAGERKGVASMLELALHNADRYAGFRYLPTAEVQHALLDGTAEGVERAFALADETRREYHLKRMTRTGVSA